MKSLEVRYSEFYRSPQTPKGSLIKRPTVIVNTVKMKSPSKAFRKITQARHSVASHSSTAAASLLEKASCKANINYKLCPQHCLAAQVLTRSSVVVAEVLRFLPRCSVVAEVLRFCLGAQLLLSC